MKRSVFGRRPSEIKGQDKKIEITGSSPEIRQPGSRAVRHRRPTLTVPGRTSPSRMIRRAILIGVACSAVALVIAATGYITTAPELDYITTTAGTKNFRVRNGDSFSASYSRGITVTEIALKGIYRFFPSDDTVITVAGIEETSSMLHRDIRPFLKPEKQTDYELVIATPEKTLGKILCRLNMHSQDWIARAETVQDTAVKMLCYNKALSETPESSPALMGRGALYESIKQYKNAIADYEKASRMNPEDQEPLQALIRLYRKTNQPNKLIMVYDRLADTDSVNAVAHYLRAAETAEKQGNSSKALSMYRKILAINRGHLEARKNLIKIYEKNKQWNRAAANTRVLLEYESDNAELYLYLSAMYEKMNKNRTAVGSVEKALKLKPRDASIHFRAALLWEKLNDTTRAISAYRSTIRYDKKHGVAYNNLGLLLEKTGKRKEAISCYEKAVALDPSDITCYINLADAYEKNGQIDNALKMYAKAVAKDTSNKQLWEALAALYYKAGNRWKAVEAYQHLAALEPKKSMWHQKSAQLYEQLDRLDKARAAYKIILGLDPGNTEAKRKYLELSKQQLQKTAR